MKLGRCTILALALAGWLPATGQAADGMEDAVAKLVTALEAKLPAAQDEERLRVVVYDFPSRIEGHDGISALSAEIQARLCERLGTSPRLALITRDKLSDWTREGDLQSTDLADPESFTRLKLKGASARIRGSYIYRPGKLLITAELALYDGGFAFAATTELPFVIEQLDRPRPETASLPPPAPLPVNAEAQKKNLQKLNDILRALPDRSLCPEIWVDGGRTHFAGGETIRYFLRADADCHVAVLCHQVDGTTVQLFPNRFAAETAVKARAVVAIPDDPGERAGFIIRIQEPYGADIVQILACTDRGQLMKAVANAVGEQERYRGQGVFAGIGQPTPVGGGDTPAPTAPVRWGEAHFIVHAYAPYRRGE